MNSQNRDGIVGFSVQSEAHDRHHGHQVTHLGNQGVTNGTVSANQHDEQNPVC